MCLLYGYAMDVVADFVRVQRGGFHLDVIAPRAAQKFLHHELGHRRPTDVTMADEKNAAASGILAKAFHWQPITIRS